jgi:putative membrane protein
MLENALVVGFVAALAAFRKLLCFSRVSYTLIFVFLCLARGRVALHLRGSSL